MKKINIKFLISTVSLILLCSPSNAMEEDNFFNQKRNFRQRIISEKNIPLDNEKWAVSFLLKPEKEELGAAFVGHAVLSFIGGTAQNPQFWAADFTPNMDYNFVNSLRAAVCVNYGYIRSFDNAQDRAVLVDSLRNFSSWQYNVWPVSKSTVESVKQSINLEKLDPPYYNFLGHDTLAAFRTKYTYNCSGWAVKGIRQCGIDIPGTWLCQFTKISAPGIEYAWNHQ